LYTSVYQGRECLVLQKIKFRTQFQGTYDIAGGDGTWTGSLWITSQSTDGQVNTVNYPYWPSTACDGLDSDESYFVLGSRDVPLSVTYAMGNSVSAEGDFLKTQNYAIDAATLAGYSDGSGGPFDAVSVALRLGRSLGWQPLAIAASLSLTELLEGEDPSAATGSLAIHNDSDLALKTSMPFVGWKLQEPYPSHNLDTSVIIGCFNRTSAQEGQVQVQFNIPITNDVYDTTPVRIIRPVYVHNYHSGPCAD
jgi:hypothetical protein